MNTAMKQLQDVEDGEIKYGHDEIFFSVTDKKGIIVYGNEVFTRLSGYAREQLIGAPHNIVRHPEMPKAAFKLLWDNLRQDKPFGAYVKNKSSDGKHYWVFATAFSFSKGYISIRIRPSAPAFTTIQALYAKMLDSEKMSGISAGATVLQNELHQLGIPSYDHFMTAALYQEIQSHDREVQSLLEKTGASFSMARSEFTSQIHLIFHICTDAREELDAIFKKIDRFVTLESKLREKSQFVISLSESLRLNAINAAIQSMKASANAQALGRVAELMEHNSRGLGELVRETESDLVDVMREMRHLSFIVAGIKLQFEMILKYLHELSSNHAQQGCLVSSEGLSLLFSLLRETSQSVSVTTDCFFKQLSSVRRKLESLKGTMLGFKLVKLAGTIEAVRPEKSNEGFLQLSQEMEKLISSAQDEIESFSAIIDDLRQDSAVKEFSTAILEVSRNLTESGLCEQ